MNKEHEKIINKNIGAKAEYAGGGIFHYVFHLPHLRGVDEVWINGDKMQVVPRPEPSKSVLRREAIQKGAEPQALTDKWEERFDKMMECKWQDGKPVQYSLDEEDRTEVKDFIRTIEQEAYERGIKDSEGTKNGVKRYLLGYEDGKREATSSLKDRICAGLQESSLNNDDTNEAIKIVRETE